MAKALGLMVSIPSGLAIGLEGPSIHIGAILGLQILNLLSLAFPRSLPVRYIRSDLEERSFVLVGSAVGIACAFRAPMAGVMFVLEEAISFFNAHLIFPVYFSGVVTYYALMLLYHDKNIPAAENFAEFHLFEGCLVAQDWDNVILYALVGALCGLLGAAFNTLNMIISRLRRTYISSYAWRRWVEALLIGTLTAVLAVTLSISWPCTNARSLVKHVDAASLARESNDYLFNEKYCLSAETYE